MSYRGQSLYTVSRFFILFYWQHGALDDGMIGVFPSFSIVCYIPLMFWIESLEHN